EVAVEPEVRTAEPLFAAEEVDDLRRRWTDVQSRFVDDPRAAVQEADALVADAMQRLTEGFARARANLEAQGATGGEADTEELRQAVQRYRSFFHRLLSV